MYNSPFVHLLLTPSRKGEYIRFQTFNKSLDITLFSMHCIFNAFLLQAHPKHPLVLPVIVQRKNRFLARRKKHLHVVAPQAHEQHLILH